MCLRRTQRPNRSPGFISVLLTIALLKKKKNRVKQLFFTLPVSVDKEFGKGTAKTAYLCSMVSETPAGKTQQLDAKSI